MGRRARPGPGDPWDVLSTRVSGTQPLSGTGSPAGAQTFQEGKLSHCIGPSTKVLAEGKGDMQEVINTS